MKNLARRLAKLKAAQFDSSGLVPHSDEWFAYYADIFDRASTCTRYVRDGSLTEIVRLNGEDEGMSGDELERLIDGFPIETARAR